MPARSKPAVRPPITHLFWPNILARASHPHLSSNKMCISWLCMGTSATYKNFELCSCVKWSKMKWFVFEMWLE